MDDESSDKSYSRNIASHTQRGTLIKLILLQNYWSLLLENEQYSEVPYCLPKFILTALGNAGFSVTIKERNERSAESV